MDDDCRERRDRIVDLLLEKRDGGMDWGEISHLEGNPVSKKLANKFLLCCLLDYRMDSDVVWRNGCRLVERILGDPDDIWRAITSVSEGEWESKHNEYKLHRYPAAHLRLWRIGKRIRDEYDGDARRIWEGKDPRGVLEALQQIGAGEQISRMVVGALGDCGQINGASDVKADVHVCRVLGRAVFGEPTNPKMAVQLARQMHPDHPWQLDIQLLDVGQSCCRPTNPNCAQCYLKPHCAYALRTK